MHLPEESDDCGNDASTGIRSAFSWDSRDTRADDLQMMDSIAWPLGKHMINKYDLRQIKDFY